VLMIALAALLVRPALRSLWGIGVLAVLLHCLVDYPLQQRPALAALFFAVAGAVAGQERLPLKPAALLLSSGRRRSAESRYRSVLARRRQ
jgi:hypothetical protein